VRNRTPHSALASWFKLAVLLMFTALCDGPAMSQVTRAIEGQVRMMGHGPLPLDITVRLEEAEGAYLAQQFVGSDGKFRFDNLNGNLYRLVVTAKGFQTVSQAVDLNWEASRCPTIYLVPTAQKKEGAPAETATDLAVPKALKEYEKGSFLLRNGNLEEARKHLEDAVAEDPCYARAHTALGKTLIMQSQFLAAESAFNKAIKCDGQFLEAYVLLTVLLNTERKYTESKAELAQGLRRFPNEWRLQDELGQAEVGSGNYEQAEQAYLKAQSINPEVPPEFHLRLAGVYLKWKKQDKAYAELESYLRAAPHGPMAEPARKMMQQLEGSGAATPGKSQVDPRPDVPAQQPLTQDEVQGLIKKNKKDLDVVYKTLEERKVDFDLDRKIEQKMRKAGADDALIQAIWRAGPTGRSEKSATLTSATGAPLQATYEEAMGFKTMENELDPDRRLRMVDEYEGRFPASQLLSYVYLQAAKAYQEKNDLNRLVEYGEKSLKQDPDNVFSLVMVALALPQPRMLQGSQEEASQRLSLAETYANRALKLMDSVPARTNETPEQLQKRKGGLASDAHAALGMVYMDRDESQKAIEELKTAVSLTQTPNPQLYFRLGEVYENEGKKNEALEAFTKASELGKGTVVQKYADEQIQALKK